MGESVRRGAHLAITGAMAPDLLRTWWRRGAAMAREPFGQLEEVGPGIWALISTPLEGDRTTLCNGGLITIGGHCIAIEGFAQPAGASWLSARAEALTGRRPEAVILTHYHSDHANGVAGYLEGGRQPRLLATTATRDLVLERNRPESPERTRAMQLTEAIAPSGPTALDLGQGVMLRLVPRRGHTPSDVTIELEGRNVVYCGDLVWNGLVPNYVDAEPSRLSAAVRALPGDARTIYVPGHGPLARRPDFERYVAVIDEIEQGARRAHAAGQGAADAAKGFLLPASLGTWTLFSPSYFERAFTAWYRELG